MIVVNRRTSRQVALVLLLLACGPRGRESDGDEAERYAERACAAMELCGCYVHFGSVEACEAALSARFTDALNEGLELVPSCFDDFMESNAVTDCTPVDGWTHDDTHCVVLQGEKGVGDPCTQGYLRLPPLDMNECGDGLTCYDGACAPAGSVGPVRAEGDSCPAEEPLSCHKGDLYCANDGVCRPAPVTGEPCTSPRICDQGTGQTLYCQGFADDGVGTCAAQSVTGEPCDPRDWFACGEGDGYSGWCNPMTGTCAADGPAICIVSEYPNAVPTPP